MQEVYYPQIPQGVGAMLLQILRTFFNYSAMSLRGACSPRRGNLMIGRRLPRRRKTEAAAHNDKLGVWLSSNNIFYKSPMLWG